MIAAAHAGERRASLRECTSLVWAGLRRRATAIRTDLLGASVAMLISSESLFALYLGALGIESAVEAPLLAPGHYPFYGTGSWRVVRHDHVLSLVAYVTILLAVAVVLGVGAARAWNRLGDNLSSRWRSVDSAVTWSQPVVGVMVAIAVATLLDVHNPSPPPVDVWRSVIVYAVGIALGSVAVLHARRRTPGSPAAIARGVIGAVLLVTAGCSAFAVARVRFGGTVFSSSSATSPVRDAGRSSTRRRSCERLLDDGCVADWFCPAAACLVRQPSALHGVRLPMDDDRIQHSDAVRERDVARIGHPGVPQSWRRHRLWGECPRMCST